MPIPRSASIAALLLLPFVFGLGACGRLAEIERGADAPPAPGVERGSTGDRPVEPAAPRSPIIPSPLGPAECSLDEAALVAVTGQGRAIARVGYGNGWTPPSVVGSGTAALTGFLSGDHFGLLVSDAEGAQTRTTYDGVTWQASQPLTTDVVEEAIAVGSNTLVLSTHYGAVVASREPGGTWSSGPANADVLFPSRGLGAGASHGAGGDREIVIVGMFDDRTLGDQTFRGGAWQPAHRHEGVRVFQNEIQITTPKLVAFDDGDDLVAVFMPAWNELAASTRHGGTWSAPQTIASSGLGVEFAVGRMATNDVVVAVRSTAGVVSVIPYSRTLGWSTPILVEAADPGGELVVTTGICGDDALVAYGAGPHAVHVARVRGDSVDVQRVFEGLDTFWVERLALVTRPAAP
jgi:hypothetical protein